MEQPFRQPENQQGLAWPGLGPGDRAGEGLGVGSKANTSRVAGWIRCSNYQTTGSVSFLGIPVTVTLVSSSSWIK